jgi:hypothetical protein
MIRPIRIPLIAATMAIFAACVGNPRGGPPAAAAQAVQTADTLIRPAAPEYEYTLLDSATADMDGDGAPERIDLAATVELDARGQPLWDDGHQWLVAVRDGADTYPLLEEFIGWGGAAFWIVAEDSAAPPAIVVQTSALAFGAGGVSLEKFVFDRARGGYLRTGVVQAFGPGALYRGPPEGVGILPPTPRERQP